MISSWCLTNYLIPDRHTDRVVTVGYYALVKLDKGLSLYTSRKGATWVNVDEIHNLIMDHMDILSDALSALQKDILWSPIAFQMLPKKFTIRQLQNLLEAVFGIGRRETRGRNFH